MNLGPDQQKRLDEFWLKMENKIAGDNLGLSHGELEFFITSELQLERERLLFALRESASVFFREHDMKPCECLMKYVDGRLKN